MSMKNNFSNQNSDQPIFAKPSGLLNAAFIETPCPTTWDKMTGDDTVRFCNLCSLNVYNIAAMTDKEAEAVLARGRAQGKMCALLYRRPDGTIMTDNCPRSLRKIRDASKWVKLKIVAAIALGMAIFSPAPAQSQNADSANKVEKKNSPPKNIPMPGGISFRWTDDTLYKEEVSTKVLSKWLDAKSNPQTPVVSFKVDANGVASGIKIVTSSGSEDIDRAALKTIAKMSPFEKPPAGCKMPVDIEVRKAEVKSKQTH